jgi:hypothetical protein
VSKEAWKAAQIMKDTDNWKLIEERYVMCRDLVARRVTSGLVLIYESQTTSAMPERVAIHHPALEMPMTPAQRVGASEEVSDELPKL